MSAKTLAATSSSSPFRLGLTQAVILFAMFSCAGWLYETVENAFAFGGIYLRAQLMLPWCPIYGIGGLLIVAIMEPLRQKLRRRPPFVFEVVAPRQHRLPLEAGRRRNPLAREVALIAIGVYVITSAVELSGSYVCEWVMGYVPWDYSHAWGNFQGRIAPAYTFRFVILGLIALYALYPAVCRFASARPIAAQRLALALAIAFTCDYALQLAGVWDGVKDSLVMLGIRHW